MIMIGMAMANSRTPACRGVYPSTNCRYCVYVKTDPSRAMNVSVTAALAALKRGFLKKPKSSIGCLQCSSHHANAPSSTAAITNAVTVTGEVQPLTGASMMANTRVARPKIDSTAPIGSRRGADGSLESGIRKKPASRPIATMGRFTRNTEPQ